MSEVKAVSVYSKIPDIESLSDLELIKRLLQFLDYEEESDSGHVFKPTNISSCRVFMTDPIEQLFKEMKDRVEEEELTPWMIM